MKVGKVYLFQVPVTLAMFLFGLIQLVGSIFVNDSFVGASMLFANQAWWVGAVIVFQRETKKLNL